ncbi:uncharacterized protein [Anabrus simplex]|uniref:uncharacterized protein n=1 Tax=Anabrus simplex TaxID=316456 RepID=UPI0035A30D1A
MDKGKSTGAYRKIPQEKKSKPRKSKSKRSGTGPEQQYLVKEGWLQWRCGGNLSAPVFVNVWCVVEDGVFHLFRERDEPDREIAALPLRDAVVQEHPGDGDPQGLPQLEFAVRCHSSDQRFHLKAKSVADRAVWLSAVTIFTKRLYSFMNTQTENVQYPTFPSRHNRKIMKRVSLGNHSKNSVQRRDSLRTVLRNAGKEQISWHKLEVVTQSKIYGSLNACEIKVESTRFRLVASEIILNQELNNLLLLIQEAEKWRGTPCFNTRGGNSMFEDVKEVKKCSDGLVEVLEETWQSKLLFAGLCYVLGSSSQKYECVINYCRHLPLYMEVLDGIRQKMPDHDSLFFSSDFNIETVHLPILRLKMMQSLLEELCNVLEETNHHLEHFHCVRTITQISKVIDKCYKEIGRAGCSKFDDTLDEQLQKCYVHFIQSKFPQESEVESLNCADSSLSVTSKKPYGSVQALQSSTEMKSWSIYSLEVEAPSIDVESPDQDSLKAPDNKEFLSISTTNRSLSSPLIEQKSYTDGAIGEKQPLILMTKEGESEVSPDCGGNETNGNAEVKSSCSVQQNTDSLHAVYVQYSAIKDEDLVETEDTIFCSSLKGYKEIPILSRTKYDAVLSEEPLQNLCKEEVVHNETSYEPNDTIVLSDNDNVSHTVLVVNSMVPDKETSGKGFDNQTEYENFSESGSLDDIRNIPAPAEDEMKCFSITEVLNIDSSLEDDSDDVFSYSSPDGHIYYEILDPLSNQGSMSSCVDEDICNNIPDTFIVQAVNEYVVCSKSVKNNAIEKLPLHQESVDSVYEEINYESFKEISKENLVQVEEPIYIELDQSPPSDGYIYDDVGNTIIHSTGAMPKKYRIAQVPVSESSTDSLDLVSYGDYETKHCDRELSLGCELQREAEPMSQMKRSPSSTSLSLHSMKKWSKSVESSKDAEAAGVQGEADALFCTAFGEAPLYQDYKYFAPSLVDDGKIFQQTHPEDPYEHHSTDESQFLPLENYLHSRHLIAIDERDSHERSGHRTYTHRAQWCDTVEVIQSGCLESMGMGRKRLQEAKFEIITSEASFYKSLCILQKYYVNDSELTSSAILTAQEKIILFSSVFPVLSVSECFLKELIEAWEKDIMLHGLPQLISKYAKGKFRAYIAYCSNQVITNRLLLRLRTRNKKFNDALERIQTNPACEAFPLQSFLTQPMQRITRFPLLVEAIIAYMNEEDEEHSKWKELLSLLQEVARECNEAVRSAERKSEDKKESSKLKYYWNRFMK